MGTTASISKAEMAKKPGDERRGRFKLQHRSAPARHHLGQTRPASGHVLDAHRRTVTPAVARPGRLYSRAVPRLPPDPQQMRRRLVLAC